jgi:beta-barrel assembly-enhancing protease
MNRRGFLSGAAGCIGCGASLRYGSAFAQTPWQPPARFSKPDIASDEGGLWAIMERQETHLRRSPFAFRDPQFLQYVQDIACRLAGEHCPDMRVYLLHTPFFNANVAPNGMMQVWTGLLLRCENEAQLAAVIGHEIGHYLQRHALERLRNAKARTGFAQFLMGFGLVGAIGALGAITSALAFSRDQEREADSIGVTLMRDAGYDAAEASRVWSNLLLELKARPGGDPSTTNPLFATHPAVEERMTTLAQLAAARPGGDKREAVWFEKTKPFRSAWLSEEIKRGQHEESLALLTRMIKLAPQADVLYARAEVYRLRATGNDLDAALTDYHAAITQGAEPPEVYRGAGFIYRTRQQATEAKTSFQRYLELAPGAPDALMIKSYMEAL